MGKRIIQINATGTAEDLKKSGTYLGTDNSSDGSKKIPVTLFAPKSTTDNLSASIAPLFSESKSYAVGDPVMDTDGKLYRCTVAHAAGAWNSDHFVLDTATKRTKNLTDNKYTGYVELDDADGTGKFDIEILFNNFASRFIPNDTITVRDACYLYNGMLVQAKEGGYQGAFTHSKFNEVPITTVLEQLRSEGMLSDESIKENLQAVTVAISKMIGSPASIEVKYTTNSVPETDGTFYEDTSAVQHWYGSDYVEIPEGVVKIAYRGINFNQQGENITPIAFYDSSKVFISCASTSSGFMPKSGEISVPANAKYFVQSLYYYPGDNKNSKNYTYYFFSHEYDLGAIKSDVESNTEDCYDFNSRWNGGFEKPVGLAGTTAASNTSYIWFQYAKPIHVTRIKFKAVEGTINFYKCYYEEGVASSFTYSLITSVVSSSSEAGLIKEVSVDVNLGKNEYIGVNGAFRFKDSSDYFDRNVNLSTGVVSTKAGQYLDFAAEYADSYAKRIENLEEEIGNFEVPSEKRKFGEVTLYQHSFAASSEDFVGTQTITNNCLVVSSGESVDAVRVRLNKKYAVADRTIKYCCKFGSTGKARFESVLENGTSINSVVWVNASTKEVSIDGVPWTCSILNTTDFFVVEISKFYLDLTIKITDMYTGATAEKTIYGSGKGGVGAGAVYTDEYVSVAMQHCYYAVSASDGGSLTISKMVVTCAKCNLLIYGDSITEGEAYWPRALFENHWVQKIIAHANGNAMSSGRSGGGISAITAVMPNEIPFIKPKYVMVTIGTNGGGSVTDYTNIVQYIKSQGCIPILNHIPCYDNNGDTTGFRTINERIDSVRTSENIVGADFDKSTSTDHTGQNVDIDKMWYEQYPDSTYYHHPNVEGCASMFMQLLMDVPQVFDTTLE